MALVAVLAVLMPGEGHPCPQIPDTVWGLTQRAERIVLGRVVRTWRVASIPEDFAPPLETEDARLLREAIRDTASRDRVEVEVLEVWKGAPAKTFTVVSMEYWDELRDSLARAGRDHRMLLFLSPLGDVWETTDVWSEVLMAGEDVAVLRDLVKEALRLQAHPPVNEGARLDWSVLATLTPATRSEGLNAIFAGEPLWDRDWSAPIQVPNPHPLNPVAQRRIATSFVARPGSSSLSQLLLALHGHPDVEVDRLSIQRLEEELVLADLDINEYLLLEAQDSIDLLSARLRLGGAGTERCRMDARQELEDLAAIAHCVRARWERIRALHAGHAP
ncbi:hypothetical protein [Pyxidicoccus trucidator]|uniref:hypothetical protein n=1 Tax=Pyxidicoccus trucidator TaxID=2709662 RepID=UPI00196765F9|nr:hypothetical protein [Pyxidicoccus trucidator]